MRPRIVKQTKTKKSIRDAFIKLYAEKDYFKITVQEICNQVNINRCTFYLHYENIDHLMREIEDELLNDIREISADFDKIDPSDIEKGKEQMLLIINKLHNYYFQNKIYMTSLCSPYADPYFIRNFKTIFFNSFLSALKLDAANLDKIKKYKLTFLVAGIVEMLYTWLNEDVEMLDKQTSFFIINIIYSIF